MFYIKMTMQKSHKCKCAQYISKFALSVTDTHVTVTICHCHYMHAYRMKLEKCFIKKKCIIFKN